MGQFVSRVHNRQDNKLYNILPMGDMPTVVFGRVIREHSIPGMQYYFSDGRVKYTVVRGSDNQTKLGWNFTIPFTTPKKFSAVKFYDAGNNETYVYRRYKKQDRKGKGWYAWAYVNDSIDKDIDDSTINWSNISTEVDTVDILYTDSETLDIGSWDLDGYREVRDFNTDVTSNTINPTQLPVIFTVPKDLDYSRMNDVEYVRQFCRVVKDLDANTVSKNFVIRRGKIICVKEFDFGNKRIFHNNELDGNGNPNNSRWIIRDFNPKYFKYAQFKRQHGKYRLNVSKIVRGCHNNEFYLVPLLKRTKHRLYNSIHWYLMHRYYNPTFIDKAGHDQRGGRWGFVRFGPYQQKE